MYSIFAFCRRVFARIIEDAPHLKALGVRLILQPMTSARELRVWLAANGFAIEEERYAKEKEKLYVVIAASYIGQPYSLSPEDSYVGFGTGDLHSEWIQKQIGALQKQVNGLAKAGKEDPNLNSLVASLTARLDVAEGSSHDG